MNLEYVHSILNQAERRLEKRPADQIIEGFLNIPADRALEPHNDGDFTFGAIDGDVVTMADALMVAKALNSWYQAEPLIEGQFATYFWLYQQGTGARGNYGCGALKRVWQPYPPSIAGNVSSSR